MRSLYKSGEVPVTPFQQRLRSHGLRATRARVSLLEHLEGAPLPVNAATIASSLGPVCDRPTVYRNLAVLAEHGLVEDLGRAAGQTWFRLANQQSSFDLLFVCTACVRAFPLRAEAPAAAAPEWVEVLQESFLLARGTCCECRCRGVL